MLDFWIEQKKGLPPAVCERMELHAAEATKNVRDMHNSDDIVIRRAAYALACCIGAQIIPILESPLE